MREQGSSLFFKIAKSIVWLNAHHVNTTRFEFDHVFFAQWRWICWSGSWPQKQINCLSSNLKELSCNTGLRAEAAIIASTSFDSVSEELQATTKVYYTLRIYSYLLQENRNVLSAN